MTIRGAELAVTLARTVLEENLEARLLAIAQDADDGFDVPMVRVGLQPAGDFYEWDASGDVVDQLPACAIHARESARAEGVDANVLAQMHSVEITFWVKSADGRTEDLVKRLWRYEAATKDLFTYRKGQLQTLLAPTGPASGCTWRSSTFSGEGDLRSVTLRFEIRIHETK